MTRWDWPGRRFGISGYSTGLTVPIGPDGRAVHDWSEGGRSGPLPGYHFGGIRHWWLVVIAALPPLLWSGTHICRMCVLRRRRRLGLCRACGYDLRHSPETCPECGLSVRPTPPFGGVYFKSTYPPAIACI